MAVCALVNPSAEWLLLGTVRLPALVAAGGMMAWDFLQSRGSSALTTGHAAHLGGALFGMLTYIMLNYKAR